MYTDISNLEDTIKTLKESVENVIEVESNISDYQLKFDSDSNELYLEQGSQSYYFDNDNTFAIEQLCNLLKIKVFKFYNDLSPDLKIEIYDEQVKKLTKRKDKVLLKIREGSEKNYVRAVLPQNYSTFNNFEVLEECYANLKKDNIKAFRCRGYGLDEPSVESIFILEDSFEVEVGSENIEFNLAISVVSSELGDANLELNGFLYQENNDLFYKLPTDGTYYSWNYKKGDCEVNSAFAELYDSLIQSKNTIKSKVEKSFETTLSDSDSKLKFFNKMELEKAAPDGIISDLKSMAFNNPSEYTSKSDLATRISEESNYIKPSEKDNNYWKNKIFSKINKFRDCAGYLLNLSGIIKPREG